MNVVSCPSKTVPETSYISWDDFLRFMRFIPEGEIRLQSKDRKRVQRGNPKKNGRVRKKPEKAGDDEDKDSAKKGRETK